MSARSNEAAMPSILVFTMLVLFAMVIGLQFLYTAGQICHIAIMAYKAGGFIPHLVSFGRLGVLLYFVVAIATATGLWAFIKHRGGARNAKTAMVLLVFSLVSSLAFTALIIMPYSDVVSRS